MRNRRRLELLLLRWLWLFIVVAEGFCGSTLAALVVGQCVGSGLAQVGARGRRWGLWRGLAQHRFAGAALLRGPRRHLNARVWSCKRATPEGGSMHARPLLLTFPLNAVDLRLSRASRDCPSLPGEHNALNLKAFPALPVIPCENDGGAGTGTKSGRGRARRRPRKRSVKSRELGTGSRREKVKLPGAQRVSRRRRHGMRDTVSLDGFTGDRASHPVRNVCSLRSDAQF